MSVFALAALLLACQKEAPAPVVPETHAWKDEAELVSSGLQEVLGLVNAGSRPAARVLAERVYTERWQPRLEPALREMESPEATAQVEYAFGQLLVDLDGTAPPNKLQERVRALDNRVRAVAEAAARSFPSPADLAAPPPAEPTAGSKPVVPDVKPRWEGAPTGG